MSVAIDLSGRIALVIGASQGIGAAIAHRLHQAGAAVVLNHPYLGRPTVTPRPWPPNWTVPDPEPPNRSRPTSATREPSAP